MLSPARQIKTLSTVDRSQPDATIQNTLHLDSICANPNTEQFYVLDRIQGFFQVIAREAQDYREIGYVVFDGYGNRVTQFDAAHQAVIQRDAGPKKLPRSDVSTITSESSSRWSRLWRRLLRKSPSTTVSLHHLR